MKKKLSIVALILVLILTVLTLLGPGWAYLYTPAVVDVEFGPSLQEHISAKEKFFQHIKKDNNSTILFNAPAEQKTPYALVYLHGFSASPREISPVVENVSANLKSQAYFPRLAGHGLSEGLMEDLTADQLFQDAQESYAIAKKLGHKVILVGTSTGASLALWLAARHPDVAGLVLISPNLGIRDPRGFLAAGPLGYWITRFVVGPFHQWKPKYLNQEQYWTTRYSVNGVRVMTDVVNVAERLNFQSLAVPALVLWTENDRVVNIQRALNYLRQMPSEKNIFSPITSEDHVLAGDITSPTTTQEVVRKITGFVGGL